MMYVDIFDILISLRKLPNKFTVGDDMIPSILIRDASQVFVPPLFTIIT